MTPCLTRAYILFRRTQRKYREAPAQALTLHNAVAHSSSSLLLPCRRFWRRFYLFRRNIFPTTRRRSIIDQRVVHIHIRHVLVVPAREKRYQDNRSTAVFVDELSARSSSLSGGTRDLRKVRNNRNGAPCRR